jgi:MFS family permease
VKALGAVSFFTDVSSEMVYPVTPVLLTKALGAPAWVVGLIEGMAETATSVLKIYSGAISDRSGKRKPLTLAGYGLAAAAKPVIGLAGVWWHVLAARVTDRIGKGLRTAPRDALIAENTPDASRGRAFGLHRAMDTAGAVTGPLLGYAYLTANPESYRNLYFLALIPALIGVMILWLLVKETHTPEPISHVPPISIREALRGLKPEYRRYLLIVGLFAAGNSSDAFLILRSQEMGISPAQVLLVYATFNIVEAAVSYRAGALSDRIGRKPIVAAGYGIFALVYLGFAMCDGAAAAWILFGVYGLYNALTQGVQRALASDFAHPHRRALELGAFHMVVGLAALPASLLAGVLYTHVSSSAPFLLGASTALAAAILILRLPRHGADESLIQRESEEQAAG